MQETANEMQARLLEVIAHADFDVLAGLYAFAPLTDGATPRKDSLASVRDGGVWSELVPVDDTAAPMAFRIFSFHFDPGLDTTGFVGWLHSHLTRSTDTEHIVLCGHSARGARGRIFSYWGCPAANATRVITDVSALIERGRRPQRPHVGTDGGCLLCEAATGIPRLPIVAESTRAIAVLNAGEPSSGGHCVFFPRRHTPNLHDLDDAEMAEVFSLVRRVAIVLELDQYNVLQNNGPRAGQTVFHAHVHLVPKSTAATGLMVLPGTAPVDQTGFAERIRNRLVTMRPS